MELDWNQQVSGSNERLVSALLVEHSTLIALCRDPVLKTSFKQNTNDEVV